MNFYQAITALQHVAASEKSKIIQKNYGKSRENSQQSLARESSISQQATWAEKWTTQKIEKENEINVNDVETREPNVVAMSNGWITIKTQQSWHATTDHGP